MKWLFLLLITSNVTAATLTIYGESHGKKECLKQSDQLANLANEDKLYLFSENVAAASEKTQLPGYITRYLNNKNVWGLESSQLFAATGVYMSSDFVKLFFELFLTEPSFSNSNFNKAENELEELELNIFDLIKEFPEFAPLADEVCDVQVEKDRIVKAARGVLLGKKINELIISRYKLLAMEYDIPNPTTLSDTEKAALLKHKYNQTNQWSMFIIVYRNYVMARELKRLLLQNEMNANKDVAIVLGAAHVTHFKYLLEQDPEMAKRYEIKTDIECSIDREKVAELMPVNSPPKKKRRLLNFLNKNN